jgi:hypothetical protein
MEYKDRFGDLLFWSMMKLPQWMVFGICKGLEKILGRYDRAQDRRRKRRIQLSKKPPRKKGAVQTHIEECLRKVSTWPPIERMSKHVASWTCEKFDQWAQKAESSGYCPEADLLRQLRHITDGTAQAYSKATLRILNRPRPPREYPDIDPEKLLWSQGFLELCMRGILLELPKEPGPNRKIIKWFFWDADFSASNINFMSMMQRIHLAIGPKGWQVLNFRNYGDFELGSLTESVSRRDFFQFQKQFNTILEAVGLKFSGVLRHTWSDPEAGFDRSDPHEQYLRDRIRAGDSNGRPRRHEIRIEPRALTR